MRWLSLPLLLLFFARLVSTAVGHAATFDEPLHLLHGTLYWQVWPLYSVVQNPPLVNAWLGWPVAWLLQPAMPPWDTAAVFQDWLPVSRAFLWPQNGALPILFVGRLAIVWAAMLLAATIARWSRQLWHSTAASLFTLALLTSDPNILAHASLATTDLGTAALFALAAWRLERALRQPTSVRIGLAGVAVGLLAAAKFSAVVLLPALLVLAIWHWRTNGRPVPAPSRPAIRWGWLGALIVAFILFAAVYRFNWAALQMDWALQQAHQREGHSSYLLGQRSLTGWWYYFPLLLVAKTPLVALGVALAAVVGQVVRRQWQWPTWWPWILAGGILSAGMASNVNIGYRYLLPMIPLVAVGAGWLATARPRLAATAALWLLVSILPFHPHYLPYFNPVAGGAPNGWQLAVDSNYDWGQDLSRLAPLLADVPLERRYLSYFGSVPWEMYGVQAQPLPGWPTARPDPLTDTFYPPAPAPGRYALSITQLLGVYLDDPDRFAYFQEQTAVARAGYTIFLYDVPAVGEPFGLALSGIGVSAVPAADWQAQLPGNDVRLRGYDGRTSLLIPAAQGEMARWAAVGVGHWPSNPALQTLYPTPALQNSTAELAYALYQWPNTLAWPPATASAAPSPIPFGQTLALVGHEWLPTGENLELITFWEVLGETTADLKLFVHVVDAAGQIVAQHDGLDIRPLGWQAGDYLAQWHTIPRPPAWDEATYTVRVGVYNAADFTRLPTAEGEWTQIATE